MQLMKISVLCVTLLLTACAGMEMIPEAERNKPIEYVLDAPGKSKDEIFSASKSWVAETFVSAKAVIDDADKDSGRIIAKGRVPRPCVQGMDCMANASNLIEFTLRIDAKDGKFRTTYSNLVLIHPATSSSPYDEFPIMLQGDLLAAQNATRALSDSLLQYVTKESVNSKSW